MKRMIEIVYISNSCKQADCFLQEMSEFLKDKHIDYRVDRKYMFIDTSEFKIISLPIHSCWAGRSWSHVKFVINDGYPTEKLSPTQFEKVNLIIDDIKSKFKSDVEHISIEQLKTLIENTAAEEN